MENQKKVWFKRKTYGWGWVPASWKGWLVIAVYVVFMVYIMRSIASIPDPSSDTLMRFVPQFVVLTVLLIGMCYWQGEEPRWSWGEDKKKGE